MDTYRDAVWWPTGDGEPARFYVCDAGARWYRVAGVYIFACWENGVWVPLFIGATSDLSWELPRHPYWPAASALGATHVHAASIESAAEREDLVRRLVAHHRPILNV